MQPQPGQTGLPSVSGQRSRRNTFVTPLSDMRMIFGALSERAAAESKKCCAMTPRRERTNPAPFLARTTTWYNPLFGSQFHWWPLLHDAEISTRVLVIDEINSILAGTARQQRLFLQLLRFLSNDLKMALICVGVPEARHALLSDAQLRSRFCDIELPLWRADADLQTFVTRLVTGLPLRRPSPIDSPKLRRLLVERSGGITICICRAIEKAAIAAIRSGREMIDLAGLADDAVWRGIALPPSTAFTMARGRRSEIRLR